MQISCYVNKGDMPLSFSWSLNGHSVDSEQGINLALFGKKTALLNIDTVQHSHAGNYTCLAKNNAGVSSSSAELIVKGTSKLIIFHLLLLLLLFSVLDENPKILNKL